MTHTYKENKKRHPKFYKLLESKPCNSCTKDCWEHECRNIIDDWRKRCIDVLEEEQNAK
jgi:hypothetical protein